MKHQQCPYLYCKIWINEAISIVTAEELLNYVASMSEDVGCLSEEILFYASIFSLHVRGLVTCSSIFLPKTPNHKGGDLNLESFNSNTEEKFRTGTGGSLILIFLC